MFSNREARSAADAQCVQEPAAVVRQLAHDLRLPLSSIEQIAYYLEMALPTADARSRRRLEKLQRELERARWTVANTVFRLEAAPARLAAVDFRDVVSRSLTEWKAARTAWICIQSSTDIPPVRVDVEQIQHLLRSLVLMFAGDTRRATIVRTYAYKGEVVLELIPPAPVEAPAGLEEPSGSDELSPLATAHGIIAAHGARLEVERPSDDGLVIRISFPAEGV